MQQDDWWLFLLVSKLLTGRKVLASAAISLALAFLVEISQLHDARRIGSTRRTALGGSLLGGVVCYTVGIGWHRGWDAHRVGDQAFRWAKIGEGFWPLGFATAVLIKPIFGNGDLESSQ